MPLFHVVLHRSGPEWNPALPLEQQSGWEAHADFMDRLVETGFVILGGPLDDESRVILAIQAGSAEEVRSTLAGDPWSGSHLTVQAVEPWTPRLARPGLLG